MKESVSITNPIVSDESRIELFPLLIRLEDEEYVVGRVDLDSFVQLPVIGAEALEYLGRGLSVAEVQAHLEPSYGEVDVADFVSEMAELEFVRSVDGKELSGVRPWCPGTGGLLAGLQGERVAWLFKRPALAMYAAFMLAGLAILVANPRYLPQSDDVFWHPSLAVSQASLFVVWTVFATSHELVHLLAAKAVGMGGHISLGRRLLFVVFQTTLLGAWGVERRRRFLPYLAGMLSDGLRLTLELTFLWLVDYGLLPVDRLWYGFVQALVFAECMGLIWEFEFYMRTDLYYVLGDLFRCRNLYEDAWGVVKGWGSTLLRRPPGFILEGVPSRELPFVRVYAGFMLAGTAVALFRFGYFSLPLTVGFIVRGLDRLSDGSGGFADGIVVILVECFDLAALAVMLLREGHSFMRLRRARLVREPES